MINTVTNNQPSGGAWYNIIVKLMDDFMVFGYNIYNDYTYYESLEPELSLLKRTQLAGFSYNNGALIDNSTSYGLRNIDSSRYFGSVTGGGFDSQSASTIIGVRPYALIY